MRSVDEFVAVEFGTIDNLGDGLFRYKYAPLSYTHLIILAHITKNAVEMCEQVYGIAAHMCRRVTVVGPSVCLLSHISPL